MSTDKCKRRSGEVRRGSRARKGGRKGNKARKERKRKGEMKRKKTRNEGWDERKGRKDGTKGGNASNINKTHRQKVLHVLDVEALRCDDSGRSGGVLVQRSG